MMARPRKVCVYSGELNAAKTEEKSRKINMKRTRSSWEREKQKQMDCIIFVRFVRLSIPFFLCILCDGNKSMWWNRMNSHRWFECNASRVAHSTEGIATGHHRLPLATRPQRPLNHVKWNFITIRFYISKLLNWSEINMWQAIYTLHTVHTAKTDTRMTEQRQQRRNKKKRIGYRLCVCVCLCLQ